MKMYRRFGTAALLLVTVPLLGLASSSTAADRQASAWRDTFQSSPARYDPLSPEFEKLLVEKFGMPPAMLEKMRPKMASGTQRIRIAVSAGGQQIRVRISNEESDTPLVLAAASVALAGKQFDAEPGKIKALTFGGRRSITVPAGTPILSDPVALPVEAGTELLVSTYADGQSKLDPLGGDAIAVAAGDQTMSGEMAANGANARPADRDGCRNTVVRIAARDRNIGRFHYRRQSHHPRRS